MKYLVSSLSAAALAAGISTAGAQQATAPAQPQPAAVGPAIVKTTGDWVVRCYPNGSSPSPCEMLEILTQKQTGRRVMAVSMAFVPQQNRNVLQIALPLGVAFAKGARIVADAYTSPALQYRRCDRNGCYVEGFVDSTVMDGLGRSGPQAKIAIASVDGRPIALPFSLRGFGDARKTMEDMAREKAGGAKPAAPPKPG